jgi:pimeloyl-ACP methyl ester carboxylesterase
MELREFSGFGGVRLVGDAFGIAENPIVLLIPSAGQVREFWHGSALALAEAGRYAICIDMRGHGDSEHAPDGLYGLDAYAADLKAVLSSLPSRAFVVGAGLGALAALTAVGESAPHLVSGMALVDTNLWIDQA